MNDGFGLLIAMYSIVGIAISIVTVMTYIRERTITGMFIVRIMFLLIYAVVPISTLSVVNSGNSGILAYKLRSLDLSEKGINDLFRMSIFSMVGYASLEIGYRIDLKAKKRSGISNKFRLFSLDRDFSGRGLHLAGIVMSVISIIALFMWSAPFGGIDGVIQYGKIIRSGYEVENISNSMGFMKHFVPFGLFASIVFLALYRTEKRVFYLLEFLAMFIVSIIYSVANDGRAPFMMYLASIFVLWWMTSKKRYIKGKKIWIVVFAVLAYRLIVNMDNILFMFRTGDYMAQQVDSDVFTFLADEFSFTVRNAQSSQEALRDGETFRILKDIVAAVFSLLPSRFTPSGVVRLETVNTKYWMGSYTYYGGKPTDLMAASLYELWYLGIVIWPFIYGVVVKKLDRYFLDSRETIYGKILFVQLIYQFAKTVGYADLSLIALNLFYIVICHIIVMIFCPKLDKSRYE